MPNCFLLLSFMSLSGDIFIKFRVGPGAGWAAAAFPIPKRVTDNHDDDDDDDDALCGTAEAFLHLHLEDDDSFFFGLLSELDFTFKSTAKRALC